MAGPVRALKLAALALLAAGTLGSARPAAADDAMPRPPQLERDVQFWIRVYTQVDTNAGFLHDEYNLGVVYETLHFAAQQPLLASASTWSRPRASASPRRCGASPTPPRAAAHRRGPAHQGHVGRGGHAGAAA